MKVELIAYSRLNHRPFVNPLAIVEEAASTCYDSAPSDEYNIAKRCVESGHVVKRKIYSDGTGGT